MQPNDASSELHVPSSVFPRPLLVHLRPHTPAASPNHVSRAAGPNPEHGVGGGPRKSLVHTVKYCARFPPLFVSIADHNPLELVLVIFTVALIVIVRIYT